MDFLFVYLGEMVKIVKLRNILVFFYCIVYEKNVTLERKPSLSNLANQSELIVR